MTQNLKTDELDVTMTIERWPFTHPLQITGYTFNDCEYGVVELRAGDFVGRGECFGVYYLNDDVAHAKAQIEAVTDRLRRGITREELLEVLPAGGARNAVDCALWDLEAKQLGRPAWQIAGLAAAAAAAHDVHAWRGRAASIWPNVRAATRKRARLS